MGKRGLAALVLALASLGSQGFDLQGHRGARGLAPENTLAGFRAAAAIGVDTLEMDVGMSRDGVLVVAHDLRLNPDLVRGPEGRWVEAPLPALHERSFAELQSLDVGRLRPDSRYAGQFPQQQARDGERIPALESVLEWVRRDGAPTLRLNIEIKTDPNQPDATAAPAEIARALVELVRRQGLTERVTVQSFDWRTLREVRRLAPQITLSALTARQRWLDNVGDARWTDGLRLEAHGGSVPRLAQAAGASIWSPFHGDLDAAALAEAHALGLKVLPWTVNDPARMDALIELGVDGLISDYPDRAREVMRRRGMTLPPSSR